MSDSKDRIAVPTNGHRPPLVAETPAADPADPADPAPGPAPDADRLASGEPSSSGPSADELRGAFTPGQVAAGFGIIAALILLVVGRRRGKRG